MGWAVVGLGWAKSSVKLTLHMSLPQQQKWYVPFWICGGRFVTTQRSSRQLWWSLTWVQQPEKERWQIAYFWFFKEKNLTFNRCILYSTRTVCTDTLWILRWKNKNNFGHFHLVPFATITSEVSYLVWRVAPRLGGFSPTDQSSVCPCHIWQWCSLVRSDLHPLPFAPPPTAGAGLWRHTPVPHPVLLWKDRRSAKNFSFSQN